MVAKRRMPADSHFDKNTRYQVTTVTRFFAETGVDCIAIDEPDGLFACQIATPL